MGKSILDVIEKEYSLIINFIRIKRKAQKISQESMGELLKITGQAYGKIENQKSELSLKNFLIICKYLNVDREELINWISSIIHKII